MEMTTKQKEKVEALIERFGADSHNIIMGALGLPMDWVVLELFSDGRQPYVLGISPEGNSHS